LTAAQHSLPSLPYQRPGNLERGRVGVIVGRLTDGRAEDELKRLTRVAQRSSIR